MAGGWVHIRSICTYYGVVNPLTRIASDGELALQGMSHQFLLGEDGHRAMLGQPEQS